MQLEHLLWLCSFGQYIWLCAYDVVGLVPSLLNLIPDPFRIAFDLKQIVCFGIFSLTAQTESLTSSLVVESAGRRIALIKNCLYIMVSLVWLLTYF